MSDTIRIVQLADARRATGGRCCVGGCSHEAAVWRRSSRRATDADGLTLAIRACAAHDDAAYVALGKLSIADVAAIVPRSRRGRRAAGARRQAERLRMASCSRMRASADLRGASSHTHTLALISGMEEMTADALTALADTLERGRGE